MRCLECNNTISTRVFQFSIKKFGIPLCMNDQEWLEQMEEKSTTETIMLYFALKEKGVPAELEKYDGYKHIDIAVTDAKVNIEVDGQHHNFSRKQALTDLKRTYHSFRKGYLTLRIPNSLVSDPYHLAETADYIVAFLNENN